jgi:hypothetical protein
MPGAAMIPSPVGRGSRCKSAFLILQEKPGGAQAAPARGTAQAISIGRGMSTPISIKAAI